MTADSGAPTARAALGRWQGGDKAGAAVLIKLSKEDQRQHGLAGMLHGEHYRTDALLDAVQANESEALHNIQVAIDAGLIDRTIFSEPAFDALRDSQEFLAMKLNMDGILASEREKALQMMCFNNPVPEAWQPLSETCDGVEAKP